jgi:enamine deaminase RidA (YjgF/YER057c/UK114 family)
MTRRLISSGSRYEDEIGYSRAVVDGDWIFVSGTTGFNYDTMTISDDVVEQCDQAFRNIEAALKQAGASLTDAVRVHYIFPNGADCQACWPVMRRYLGTVKPAITIIQAGLLDAAMKLEIEVTARRQA